MKYSKQWLNKYIEGELPHNDVIISELNARAFEMEEVIGEGEQTVFDIKVLPNRFGDALSHFYMAQEIAGLCKLTMKAYPHMDLAGGKDVSISVEDARKCPLFEAVRITGVRSEPSPAWLKDALESIGQRSINTLVDVTNYVQFAINKPLHAYDARLITGGFVVRNARPGEKLITLSDAELALTEDTLVIADTEKVLGLAGIKGGKASGVAHDTTEIVLESANFNPVLIRKTARTYNIHTDASKRFEAGQSLTLVREGLAYACALYKELYPDCVVHPVYGVGSISSWKYKVGFTVKELSDSLGASLSGEQVEHALQALRFPFQKTTISREVEARYPDLLGAAYAGDASMRADAPGVFSCSSLVSYLYTFAGVYMPSLAIDKYVFSRSVDEKDVRPYDLVFATTGEGVFRHEAVEFMRGTPVPEEVDHVGIVLPGDKILHATRSTGTVVAQTKEEFFTGRTLVKYGRVADAEEERYVIDVPDVRVDVRRPEDVIEELGRMIGYQTLVPVLPVLPAHGTVPPYLTLETIIKNYFVGKGFTEVMTSSFAEQGDIYIEKGMAQDKEALRTSIAPGLLSAYQSNIMWAPLLGVQTISLFEIGAVFTTTGESRRLAIVIDDGKKKSNFSETVDFMLMELKSALGIDSQVVIPFVKASQKPYAIEIAINDLLTHANLGADTRVVAIASRPEVKYKPVSQYPLITRDVSTFVPFGVSPSQVHEVLISSEHGLCKRVYKVDEFEKTLEDGTRKHSLAYRLVYQADDRTLTDTEVNELVSYVYEGLTSLGCEVR